MTDPVRRYLDARVKYEEATARCDEMIGMIRGVAMMLFESPLRFSFSNCSVIMPAEAVMIRSDSRPSPDANRWPTADQIHQALKNVHTAKDELQSAWSTLATTDRAGLQSPPEKYVPKSRPAHA